MHATEPIPPVRRSGIFAGITRNVVLVGLVSFFTDSASEMIFPLMPVFLSLASVGGGVSVAMIVGVLEGLAETTSALLKLWAGLLTDRIQRKKPLVLIGYGISSVVRPLTGLATAWWHPVVIRVADRVGKGIRSAPRDVLIAESTPAAYRGKAFGFHRSMDHLGAVVGPLIAVFLLFVLAKPGFGEAGKEALLRTIFFVSAIPGLICLAVILFCVRDANAVRQGTPFRPTWRVFSPDYRLYLVSLLVFTLGNSTDMFLVLRAAEVIKAESAAMSRGVMALAMVPLLWAFFHAFKTLTVAPLGSLSDRVGRRSLIRLGWGIYALVYLGFGLMNRAWQAWPLFALYALYYGFTEGSEKALVVDLAPEGLRGTAVGMYHFTIGIASLPASVLFGLVYAKLGPMTAFAYAAALAVLAAVLLSVKVNRRGSLINQEPTAKEATD